MQLKDHIDRGLCSYSDTPFVNISNASTAFPLRIILKYALPVGACLDDSDCSRVLRLKYVEVSSIVLQSCMLRFLVKLVHLSGIIKGDFAVGICGKSGFEHKLLCNRK